MLPPATTWWTAPLADRTAPAVPADPGTGRRHRRQEGAGGGWPRGGPSHSRALRRALAALCLTEITSYGVLYYAFPVMLGDLTRDTGWSPAAAMAAFSTGLGVSALAGVPVGRMVDRFGPRPVMTAGSVVGTLAVAGIAAAPGPVWFTLAWAVAGLAQAALFYPPAFAAITHWFGPDRVKALTVLTLGAGLASTVFAPVTAALLGHLSWRGTYLVLAAVLAAVTIPLHVTLLTPPWRQGAGATPTGAAVRGERTHVAAVLRSRTFLVLVVSLTLGSFGLLAAAVNLVPLLTGAGLSTGLAAWALGLSGAGQVLGRLAYPALARLGSPATRTGWVLFLGALTTVLVGLFSGQAGLAVTLAIIAGAARGLFTLLSATAVSDRWGTSRFGTLNGVLHAPLTAAMAVAPWAGTVLAGWLGGYPAMFALLAAAVLVAAVTALGTVPRAGPSHT